MKAILQGQKTLGKQGQVVGFDADGKAVATEVGGVNLFANATSVPGYLSDANDGNISSMSAAGERTSDYLSVVAGENITVQTWATSTETTLGMHYMIDYMWFADKTPESHINDKTRVSGGSAGFNHATVVTAKAPANAKYIRVSARLYSDGKMKIERGNVATDWSPAPEDKQNALTFDDTPKESSENPVKSKGIKSYVDTSIQTAILDSWEASY